MESVDLKAGAASIAHGPVASLKWPAMTMEFGLRNPGLLRSLKPGSTISFDFAEETPGNWVILRAQPLAQGRETPGAALGNDARKRH